MLKWIVVLNLLNLTDAVMTIWAIENYGRSIEWNPHIGSPIDILLFKVLGIFLLSLVFYVGYNIQQKEKYKKVVGYNAIAKFIRMGRVGLIAVFLSVIIWNFLVLKCLI